MTALNRFWLRFSTTMQEPHPAGALLGVGVTAFDRDDALALVQHHVFGDTPMPDPIEVREGVAIEQLDQRHVIPNMGNALKRGVWYPLGY